MRFRELQLLAFGHFTGKVLSFTERPLSFHLVYGHNEAGKSTALRAVRDLLYGIPQQSADTFLHTGAELRIGAILEDESGQTVHIVRRKGRKNTLLDGSGNAVDEATLLSPLLGDVDETLFESMFGLNHESLRHGARDLLSGTGNLSESLFGASVGSGKAHRLLNTLRQQAEELFTSRGRGRKRINQEIAEVREAHKLVTQHSTTAQGYHEREKNLEQVSQELERVKGERARLKATKSRLERQLGILPRVAKLRAVRAAREALGDLPRLPDAVEEWRREAVTALQEAERQTSFLSAEIEHQKQLLTALDVPEALAELETETVEALSHSLGQFRKAQSDLPKRRGELRAIEDEARELLRSLDEELPLERADSLRLSKADEQRLRRLCREKVRIDATLLEREVSCKESQRVTSERRRELDEHDAPRDTAPLRAALERARAQLDLEERLDAERRNVTLGERRIEERFKALGRFSGAKETIVETPFPPSETVARFASDFDAIDEARRRLEQRAGEIRSQALTHQRELAELEGDGEVPSAEELTRLRSARDARSLALREAVSNNQLPSAPELRLALERLRDDTVLADQYADRLRLEASRVNRAASLRATLQGTERELSWHREQLESVTERGATLSSAWQELWRPLSVDPLPPREMAAWLPRAQELRGAFESLKVTQSEVRRLEARMAELEKELTLALESVGQPKRTLWESLAQFIQRGQATLSELETKSQSYRDARHRLTLSEQEDVDGARRLAELKDAQKQFRAEWSKGLKLLGLEKDAGAEEVTDTLDRRSELFHKLKERSDLERRINGILRDEERLQEQVEAIAGRVAKDLLGLSTGEAAERLLRAHRKAAVDAREHVRLRVELERHQSELRRVSNERVLAEQRLAELLRLARVETSEDLVAVENKVREARLLERQRAELEDEIVAHGEGSSLDELLRDALETSAEELRERTSQAEVELGVLDDRLEALVQERTTRETQLDDLGLGAFAALEELALRTAKLRASVRSYMKLRVASAILGREVERYRDEHQGPLLKLASHFFPRLTLGAYAGLKVGFDKRDEQILLCVTSDGAEKHVDALSDGARDQLYLSLRLATLEHYMERATRMPLVLDDILIHFDDDRARATLSVLGEVATKTQVLFFTHHRRLVELAREAIPNSTLNVCELGTPEASPAQSRLQASL